MQIIRLLAHSYATQVFLLLLVLCTSGAHESASASSPELERPVVQVEKYGSFEQRLSHGSIEDRIALLSELGGSSSINKKIAKTLIKLLSDQSPAIRAHAAAALVRLGDVVIPSIVHSLTQSDTIVGDYSFADARYLDEVLKPRRSDYLAWVLINTRKNPSPELLSWARKASRNAHSFSIDSVRNRVDPEEFVLFVLLSRGSDSVEAAGRLLKDSKLSNLGWRLIVELGPVASGLLERLESFKTPRGGVTQRTLGAVRAIGPEGQRLITDWLSKDPDPEIRASAVYSLLPTQENSEILLSRFKNDTSNEVKDAIVFKICTYETLPEIWIDSLVDMLLSGSDHGSTIATALKHALPTSERLRNRLPALVKYYLELNVGSSVEQDELKERLERLFEHMGAAASSAFPALMARLEARNSDTSTSDVAELLRTTSAIQASNLLVPEAVLEEALRNASLSEFAELVKAITLVRPNARWWTRVLSTYLASELDQLKMRQKPVPEYPKYYDYVYQASQVALLQALADSDAHEMARLLKADPAPKTELSICNAALKVLSAFREDGSQTPPPSFTSIRAAFVEYCLGFAKFDVGEAIGNLKVELRANQEIGKQFDAVEISVLHASIDNSQRPAFMLALVADDEIPLPRSLGRLCLSSEFDEEVRVLKSALIKLSWRRLAALYQRCRSLFEDSDVALKLLERLANERGAVADWNDAWFSAGANMVESLMTQRWKDAKDRSRAESTLLQLIDTPVAFIRLAAVRALALLERLDIPSTKALSRALSDPQAEVRLAAAQTLLIVESGGAIWDRAASIVVTEELIEEIDLFVIHAAYRLRPPMQQSGPPIAALREFPWPPPASAKLVTFGHGGPSKEILGLPADDLGAVYRRLVRTLNELDPNYETSLFSVRGGFALLTRMEQTDEKGFPVLAPFRWRSVQRPPESVGEFLVRFLLAPPGHYRVIAFVFTDDANFGSAKGRLPSLDEGGTILPDDVASIKLGERNAYAVVYAFVKRDWGAARPNLVLGGLEHLNNSGILARLRVAADGR